jgi:hypothetical protein
VERAMNGVRIAISIFLLALLTLVVLGWSWTGRNQPPAQATARPRRARHSGVDGRVRARRDLAAQPSALGLRSFMSDARSSG